MLILGTYQQLGVLIHCIPLSWGQVKGSEAHALANPVAGMRVKEESHPADTCRQELGVWSTVLFWGGGRAALSTLNVAGAGVKHAKRAGARRPRLPSPHLGQAHIRLWPACPGEQGSMVCWLSQPT